MATAVQRVCPKCGHVREAVTTSPAWRCPACGITHDEYAAELRHAMGLPKAPGVLAPAPAIHQDGSVWSLIAANGLTLAIALLDHWSLASLMIVYWTQCVAIGVSNVFRILAFEGLSTESLVRDIRPADLKPEVIRALSGARGDALTFFALGYGLILFLSLAFILIAAPGEPLFDTWFWVCAFTFALNHFWSYRYNRELDRRGITSADSVARLPYVRIIPMQITIAVGGLLASGSFGMLLFSGLKTVVDVGMHVIEHAQLRKLC